jgi:hypothetical protein
MRLKSCQAIKQKVSFIRPRHWFIQAELALSRPAYFMTRITVQSMHGRCGEGIAALRQFLPWAAPIHAGLTQRQSKILNSNKPHWQEQDHEPGQ